MLTKKINWLLILQGWAMLWVVIGHSPLSMDSMPDFVQHLYKIAYSFHMPLFIFVSGYLFFITRIKNNKFSYNQMLVDKFKRLLIPFFVFTLIAMIVKVLFSGFMNRSSEISASELINAILYPREGPLMEMWFVITLIWMFALQPLWKLTLKTPYLEMFCLICCAVLHFYPIENGFLCIHDVCRFLVYFYMGVIFAKALWVDHLKHIRVAMLSIALFCYVFAYIFEWNFICSISGIVTSICLALILDSILPNLFSSFRQYGKNGADCYSKNGHAVTVLTWQS